MALALLLAAVGCAPSGPTEVADGVATDEEVSCFRVSSCVEEGDERVAQGRFSEALPYLIEACERGAIEGCRPLARLWAIGAVGEPDFDRAAALYQWGCAEADDGPSCHAHGELRRLGVIDDPEGDAGRRDFERACQLGELAGCHDEIAVVVEQSDGVDGDVEERALETFEELCDKGLSVACTNRGYMQAAGRGTGREHREARSLFENQCDSDDWSAHDLAGLSHDVDPDVYAVAEYSPDVACEQLELLIVGGYEERIIGAMNAETDSLHECYDGARSDGESTSGRIAIEAGVSADGDGISPRIVRDELGIDEVADCVDQVLSRHLDDGSDAGAEYQTRWGISFVTPPEREFSEATEEGYGDCDAEAVQRAVGDHFAQLQDCGSRHLEVHPDDPGAVVAVWTMESSGTVGDVAMETTVEDAGLTQCLEETIRQIEIPPFEGQACPVQVPFLFSEGNRLHFSVVGE